MERWVGKVAVVTGASAGIGKAIAIRLVEEGLTVVALARSQDKLDELKQKVAGKKGKIHIIKSDVTKEKDILDAFKFVKEKVGPVHILINNAGTIAPGQTLSDGDTETWQNIFQLNVIALCVATREAIRSMKAHNIAGHIIHINSIEGQKVTRFPVTLNVYPASKQAVTALTETLRLELVSLKSKIKVTSLSPGVVRTEKMMAGNYPDDVVKMPMLELGDLADTIVYILSTPPHVQIHELTIKPVGEEF